MHVSKIYSAQVIGMRAEIVTIEVDLSNGLHAFSIVGLGDKAVGESKDRISAAIKNSGFVSPKQKNQKVVISLAPADMRKEGTVFDIGMALGYLSASGDIHVKPDKKLFIGELSLEGNLRKISGILAMVRAAKSAGFTEIFLPKENGMEAALVSGIRIYPATSLMEIIGHLDKKISIPLQKPTMIPVENEYPDKHFPDSSGRYGISSPGDFSEIIGQESTKRALEIAAAGRHNIAMYGPPGTGKTMLAKAFIGILPRLSHDEILEVTEIHSIARILGNEIITAPPFRSPHHTSSYASLVGGGNSLHPGEITLAHRGVLFLDEFPEFDTRVIDALRQPLEDKTITLARAKGSVTYPAHCIFIAALNPCPCGYAGDIGSKKCICSNKELARYEKKISGPIIDRIDIWTRLSKIEYEKFTGKYDKKSETSHIVRERIVAARKFHSENVNGASGKKDTDGSMRFSLSMEAEKTLILMANKFELSGRAYHRSIRVARTIADLAFSAEIKKNISLKPFSIGGNIFEIFSIKSDCGTNSGF